MRKPRNFKPNHCYHLISRIAHRAFFLTADAKATCTLLDDKHDLEPQVVTFKEGVLNLVKPDFFSAAFFVEFE